MLGDIIKKGHSLESSKIKNWKARNREQNAFRSLIDVAMLPVPKYEDLQDAHTQAIETAERELEQATRERLILKEGKHTKSIEQRARHRTITLASWVLLKLRSVSPEPFHPYLDKPQEWLHERGRYPHEVSDPFDELDINIWDR